MKKRIQKILGDTDQKEILSKGFSFLVFRILGAVVGYLFIFYVSNTYGADIYGLIALGLSMFLIISEFGRLGLDTNIVKFFSQDKHDSEAGIFFKSLGISFFASSFLAWVVYYFSDVIVLKFYQEPKPELLEYLPWILFAIPFWNIAMISASFLRAKKRNNAFAFLNNPSRFLFSLLLVIFISYFFEKIPLNIVKAHFWGVIISAIIGLSMVFKSISGIEIKSKTKSIAFVKESFPMLLSSSILILLGLTDTQVLGVYESNTEIGIYNVSLKLAALTTFSLQAINSILAPKIARSYADNDETNYKKLIAFSTKLNFIISTIIVIVMLTFHKYLLSLFGEDFETGSQILIIFCVGQLVNSFSGSVGIILQMIGKQKVLQNFVFIAFIINLMLTFALTPRYGGLGAATATVISMLFWNIGSAIYLKKRMNITSYYTFK